MSKAKARARKKARLAKKQAMASAPAENHETGADPTPAKQAANKSHPGRFNPNAPPGGNMKSVGKKNIPNLAASTRGSARSR